MSLSRVKTWSTGEVLTSTDLNAEFTNITDSVLVAATQSEVNDGTSTTTCLTPFHNKIISGTRITGSAATHDFSGIPSGTRRISVHFVGVSTSGTSDVMIQLGDAGGIETSGYLGSVGSISGTSPTSATYTTGFVVNEATAAASVMHGIVRLELENAATFTWTCIGVTSLSNTAQVNLTAGSKSLTAELTQIRITTVGGAETFDAGTLNITYER